MTTTTQQDFLHTAMSELGTTPEQLAARLGCAEATLDRWLLPRESDEHRVMNDATWMLLREILAHQKSQAASTRLTHALIDRVGPSIAHEAPRDLLR